VTPTKATVLCGDDPSSCVLGGLMVVGLVACWLVGLAWWLGGLVVMCVGVFATF
jgi:hypothetical protein